MDYAKRNNRSTVFRIVPKFKKEKIQKHKTSPQPGMCFEITRKIITFGENVILCLSVGWLVFLFVCFFHIFSKS